MSTAVAFSYTGRDTAGKNVKGQLDALSESQVASRLNTLGIAPISIAPVVPGTGLGRSLTLSVFARGVRLKDLAIMSRQFATMIGAGLSLLRALSILTEQTESKPLAAVLALVRDDVEAGQSISESLAKHPLTFPPIMVNMVRAGETGGFLDGALNSIAENFEKEVKLRGTIKSAMTYPVIVLAMSFAAVLIMLIFIVPIFQDMFTGLGGALPLPTQLLVTLSESMIYVVPIGAVLGVAFALWWRRSKHTEAVRRRLDPLRLKLPVFGLLLKKIAVARFSRNFSNMLGAGVPILQALKIVGETSGNWAIENALTEVGEAVRRGKSVSEPLLEHPVFPAMVVQMIAVGEDAGTLELMLDKIADFYDQEVQSATEQLTAMIEPLLIAFLGVVIGGMVIALYLPIFSIASMIK
ncbi:type II secretion system F family protein [Cryobacterium levicorallinum]|uniref:Type IV pilus assembly protein PilC n=1 Tax=Cryobacterium levicorallinum TaxID=995038 RepID=A0ABY1EG48_9MICO|nr:type II secretion system F family protein [Cryobacterium levicorallinum]GEP27456.1 type II secretion system protein F [Cryobacterium levicorallinum]SFH71894.1 type IV pilus assembly protein PilC [Cryobacterium levicorallinum]